MANKVEDLAERVATLSPNEIEAFEQTLAGLSAERDRAEEARIAGLQAMPDEKAVFYALQAGIEGSCDEYLPEAALRVLRDAGFVRGATLQAAYRAGYERYGHEHLGDGHPLQDEDDYDYVRGRDYDLRELAKDDDVPAYMRREA